MRFVDRVKALEDLVLKEKEILVSELPSILQVSPNYVIQIEKEVVKRGRVLEEWINNKGPYGAEKCLVEKKHFEKILESE
jgi:hypothetical protein